MFQLHCSCVHFFFCTFLGEGISASNFASGGLRAARIPIIATCGSGVTACVIAAGLRIAGFDHQISVYGK